jgi:subtilisin family serine protease
VGKIVTMVFAVILFIECYPQRMMNISSEKDVISIPLEFEKKIGSADLIISASEKKLEYEQALKNGNTEKHFIQAIIYLTNFPSSNQLIELKNLGINILPESWTPPAGNHPLGFLSAEIPIDKLLSTLQFDFIQKIDCTKNDFMPQSNRAIDQIQAEPVWSLGYTGQGVKIGILDTGLDTEPYNSDLPMNIIKKDYSKYPFLDDDIENKITGHGTLVTSIVAGQGVLSANNTLNGGGPYKGTAPGAEIVFLKVGNDVSGGASTNAILNALDAAVNIYGVDVITLSYGSWDVYHDGSATLDQKVDWCYSQGVPVFLAAGNEGASGRHFSGLVNTLDSTDFIQVNVTNAAANSTSLSFNLVYADGLGINKDLKLKFYSNTFEEITNIYRYTGTESIFGTESRIAQSFFRVPAGNSIYYLRVINNSDTEQSFNIYEHFKDGKVKFANPDPNYTLVSPATATFGFAVGSYNSSDSWIAYDGTTYSYGGEAGFVSSFSSRGPRVDGLMKPDLVAPGSAIIALRDRDIYQSPSNNWVNNNSNPDDGTDYYVAEGTSFSAPFAAGVAALVLSKYPGISPAELYDILRNYTTLDNFTGNVPNPAYGFGKLNAFFSIMNSRESDPMPVELTSFTGVVKGSVVKLNWITETETNNYGFDIERSSVTEFNGKIIFNEWSKIGFVAGNGNSNSPKNYSFEDKNPTGGSVFGYRLKQIDSDGSFEYSDIVEVEFSPNQFELLQNYPNPFNPVTTIRYSLVSESFVTLNVYNILGQEVASLINEQKMPGSYEVNFNAENLASGSYFYKLQAGDDSVIKNMILMK